LSEREPNTATRGTAYYLVSEKGGKADSVFREKEKKKKERALRLAISGEEKFG